MRVRDALEQLDAIHEHLTKAEVYRGFRVPGVALVGVVGLAAAAFQERVLAANGSIGFVTYWLVVAAVGALLGGGAAAHAYIVHEDEFDRRRTRRLLGQFLPCVLGGACMTAAFGQGSPDAIGHLPGLWAIVFGLGLISARPYLPKGIGTVGLGYLAAGSLILARPQSVPDPSGWSVGGVFGGGHLATAYVLWRDRARDTDA